MTKRLCDVVVGVLGLVLAAPVLVVAAAAIRLETPGPALFRQERVGRGFRPFHIYKLRTMAVSEGGPEVTRRGDARITRVGRILRRAKLDEVPQLLNVVKGDMSLVGPRPEVPRYVALLRDQFTEILTIRPGMTGMAAVTYRNEEALLAAEPDPERAYLERILPDKLRLERAYLRHRSALLDLRLLAATLLGGKAPSLGPGPAR